MKYPDIFDPSCLNLAAPESGVTVPRREVDHVGRVNGLLDETAIPLHVNKGPSAFGT